MLIVTTVISTGAAAMFLIPTLLCLPCSATLWPKSRIISRRSHVAFAGFELPLFEALDALAQLRSLSHGHLARTCSFVWSAGAAAAAGSTSAFVFGRGSSGRRFAWGRGYWHLWENSIIVCLMTSPKILGVLLKLGSPIKT